MQYKICGGVYIPSQIEKLEYEAIVNRQKIQIVLRKRLIKNMFYKELI